MHSDTKLSLQLAYSKVQQLVLSKNLFLEKTNNETTIFLVKFVTYSDIVLQCTVNVINFLINAPPAFI